MAGAADGIVKLWDVRMAAKPVGVLVTPPNARYPRATVEAEHVASLRLPGGARPHGVSGMVQDPTGVQTCTLIHKVVGFDTCSLDP